MPGDRDDPIADTGMFRAFVAKGEADTERKSVGVPIVLAVIAALVIAAVLIKLFSG